MSASSPLHALLKTSRYGRALRDLDVCGSTNDEARAWASSPTDAAPDGAVVLAREQTRGRGRQGRSWHSPPEEGLYFSVVARPQLPPTIAPLLSLTAGLAVAEACSVFLPAPAQVKWPNDILFQGKKLGGVLLSLSASQGDRCDFVIIGIGVNVSTPREHFPEALQDVATSLTLAGGRAASRYEVLAEILSALEKRVDLLVEEGFSPIRDLWRARSATLGKRVEVSQGEQTITGRALDIDEDGTLWVESDKGERLPIVAGDVHLLDV